MADENKPDQGVPAQAGAADLNDSQIKSGEGLPTPPAVNNTPPPKDEALEETFADPKAKAEPEKKADPEPKKDEGKEPKKDDTADTDADETEYMTYDDPAADGIVAVMKEAGVTVDVSDEIFREAAETGDLSKIKVDKLVEVLGKQKADMVLLAAQDYYNRTFGTVQAATNAVYETLGGEANWLKVRTWAHSKMENDPAFKQEMTELNKMFDLGKTSAALAAKSLKERYESDPKNSSLSANITAGSKSAAGVDMEPISRAEYVTQLKAAHDKNDVEEINRLNALRAATRNLKH